MTLKAKLSADAGAAATDEEFFRSAQFCCAEGVTHSLVIETGAGLRLAAPLLVRDVAGEAADDEAAASRLSDGISPYAYPGFTVTATRTAEELRAGEAADPIDSAAVDWATTGLVSIFIRHRLGAPPLLTGATPRNTVLISDPDLPRKSRMSDRQQIRKNLRAGFEVVIIPGPKSDSRERAAFLTAYTETMHRTDAAPRYFFDAAYFDTVFASPASWLFLVREPGGEVAAASIAVRSDGMLHYYLSGTADAHLRGAPMKNLLAEMTDFAWQRGLPLNLGGGMSPGDRLEEFKRGFANREERFYTSEIVCDPAAYRQLSAGRDAAGFFPAYRAPLS